MPARRKSSPRRLSFFPLRSAPLLPASKQHLVLYIPFPPSLRIYTFIILLFLLRWNRIRGRKNFNPCESSAPLMVRWFFRPVRAYNLIITSSRSFEERESSSTRDPSSQSSLNPFDRSGGSPFGRRKKKRGEGEKGRREEVGETPLICPLEFSRGAR